MKSIDISIVIPLYNEEDSITELMNWIYTSLQDHSITYEVIIIDDGSDDDSWIKIKKLSTKYSFLRAISFYRNYGKSAALDTGFKIAKGEVIITIDADMQDSPEEIMSLYSLLKKENCDIVSGWKKNRKDRVSKVLSSKLFNYATRMLSGIKIHDFNCGLKAYKKRVVKSISIYGEMHRYLPIMAWSAGFKKIIEKPVKHFPRKYGKSKYGIDRFVKGFLDLLSVLFISFFKKSPMYFFGGAGIIAFLLGFLSVTVLVIEKLYYSKILRISLERELIERPLFYIALVTLVIGVQLFLTGLLAEMMIYSNHKEVNSYLTKDQIKTTT